MHHFKGYTPILKSKKTRYSFSHHLGGPFWLRGFGMFPKRPLEPELASTSVGKVQMTLSTAPAISIQNAHLRYGEQVLFDDLTCHLPAGKTTCLLGPSGVGKSSLLRLIAGLGVTSGNRTAKEKIQIDQHDPSLIAYMAQTDLLMPWLSVLDNVLLGYRLRKESSPETRAHELLNQVGLGNAIKKYPAQLSGGMRQRVALVRTLMEERPVVLMDEPFSALDTITRLKLQKLAAELLANRTVLLITHDPLEALRLGHQILIMSGQPAKLEKLELSGTPPRSLTDEKLLRWQGELMERLT